MNNVDKQYLDLLQDIINNGTYKKTRAGEVLSVFGRQIRFNLSDGLPILTTKKVFTKGVIHELLWFLSGKTNIKYLLDNNVHIWDDDAFRFYIEKVNKHNELVTKFPQEVEPFELVSKATFLCKCQNCETIHFKQFKEFGMHGSPMFVDEIYNYGDLGDVYGKSWRNFGVSHTDQIQNIIDTLKTNPDDRRMLCMAFNPDVLEKVALPPCHVMFQFYTRELSNMERFNWLCEHSNGEYDEWKSCTDDILYSNNVPKRALSLMWTQRSVDCGLGLPFNILSYSILTHLIAQIANMAVGELVGSLGDTHIYCNQLEGINEQLTRDPYKYNLPKLVLNPLIKNINEFTYDDIHIEDYESYPKISLPLSVGYFFN